MKKINIITILAIVILAISCKKEETKFIDNTSVHNFSSITLGNQSSSTYNCFLSFDSAKVSTLTNAHTNQSKIDLIFLHNNPDNLAMFVSPASIDDAITISPDIYTNPIYGIENWTTRNSIQIGITDISVADYKNISTNGQLHTAYENDPHVTIGWEIDITPNKVYKYTSNRTGKRGLIKVNSINGNYNSAGSINFDIKQIN
jgi:hypothetical protein